VCNAEIRKQDEPNHVVDVYFSCKGPCDKALEDKYYKRFGAITKWQDLTDLLVPIQYLSGRIPQRVISWVPSRIALKSTATAGKGKPIPVVRRLAFSSCFDAMSPLPKTAAGTATCYEFVNPFPET